MSDKSPRTPRWRSVVTATAAAALGLTMLGTAPAAADPINGDLPPALTPSVGPEAGGTTVTGAVPGVTFTQVVAAADGGISHGGFNVALTSEGLAFGWGSATRAQLPVPDGSDFSAPFLLDVPLPEGVYFVDVALGANHGLLLDSEGTVWAWGRDNMGQLARGTATATLQQAEVLPITTFPADLDVVAIFAGSNQSFALGEDGRLFAWGQNQMNQLGLGHTTSPIATPALVTVIPADTVAVHAEARTSLSGMLTADGRFVRHTGSFPALPDPVTPLTFSVGGTHQLSLGDDGQLYLWGGNSQGQVGIGSTSTTVSAPTPVDILEATLPFIGGIARANHSFAIDSDGSLWGWGQNRTGVIGDGVATTGNRLVPVSVALPDDVRIASIASSHGAGDNHTVAIDTDGKLWTWGASGPRLGRGLVTGTEFTPGQIVSEIEVTGVTFGGVPGTSLDADGAEWTVVTPAGTGTVDVVVTWTQYGATHTTVFEDGFTFELPSITGGSVVIEGAAVVGGTLTASATGFDPVPGNVAFQWYADGVAIAGATEATLDLTAGMVGDVITVTATASLAGFTSRTVTSDPVTVVEGTFTGGTATITGSPVVGGTLTVSATGFDPAPGNVVFQWYADGVAIVGATGATLVLTAAMVGSEVTATATASLAGFTSRTVTSAPVTVVAVPQASPSPTPTETVPPTPVPTPTETPGAPTPTPTPPAHDDWECPTTAAFVDVPVGSQFHCYIEWLALTGITTGWVLETHAEFRPMLNIERQAMSAFLYRGLAEEGVFTAPGVPTFVDKSPGDTFFRHVEWMADTGITRGWEMPDGGLEYRPLAGVERQAMAAFIYRAAGSPDFTAPTTPSFRDVPASSPFFLEIEWMAQTGITVGWQYDDYRLFRPSDNVERQAMAAFLYRAFNNEGGHLDDTHLTRP